MTLLHPALLAGLALVAVPVVLHLLMKARPKPLVFPALRLLQERTQTTARRLKLRHLWLLALRMAVLAGLVLALTRPRLPAGDYALQAGDWIRLALAGLLGVGAWAFAEWFTRRQSLPRHALAWRRSLLRSGAVLVGLLALLLLFWPAYQRRVTASFLAPAPSADESLPVTAVLIFDTSLSMEYQQESQTRLDVARKLATQHIRSFPAGSRVAVCDTRDLDPIRFLPDTALALKRIEQLAISPRTQPVEARLLQALDAHVDDRNEQSRLNGTDAAGTGGAAPPAEAGAEPGTEAPDPSTLREIYLLTDLTAGAWQIDGHDRLKARLAEVPTVACHLIDVGVESPNNLAITGIELEAESVALGTDLPLRVTVAGVGTLLGKRTVELHLLQPDGSLTRQGTPQELDVVEGTASVARFNISATQLGGVQGEVRLVSSDPLTFDDTRHVTLLAHEPPGVWLISDSAAEARFVQEALAPGPLVAAGQAQYRCELASPSRLADGVPPTTGLVCLLNIASPGDAGWRRLGEFVERGGSLWIILGDRVSHAAYLTDEARKVLPAELAAPLSFRPPEFLDMPRAAHPALRRFADWGSAALSAEPILRYWRVDPAPDASVLVRYTDPRQGAALLERTVGRGRVLLQTTPLDRRGWNDLPVAGWEYVALVDQLAAWLTPQSRRRGNFEFPAEVRLEVTPQAVATSRLLRRPNGEQALQEIAAQTTTVVLKDLDQVGNYRLLPGEQAGATDAPAGPGSEAALAAQLFSLNAAASESQLTRLGSTELDQRLGAERYGVTRTLEQLERRVRAGRQGREVFPWLVTLVVLVFVAEHWLSNRFHDGGASKGETREGDAAGRGGAGANPTATSRAPSAREPSAAWGARAGA